VHPEHFPFPQATPSLSAHFSCRPAAANRRPPKNLAKHQPAKNPHSCSFHRGKLPLISKLNRPLEASSVGRAGIRDWSGLRSSRISPFHRFCFPPKKNPKASRVGTFLPELTPFAGPSSDSRVASARAHRPPKSLPAVAIGRPQRRLHSGVVEANFGRTS